MAPRWLLLAVLALSALAATTAEIKLQSFDRKINLDSQYARITEVIKAKNTGSSEEASLVLCDLTTAVDKRAFYKVTQGGKALTVTPTATPAAAPAGVSCVSARLSSPLQAGGTAELETLAVLVDVLEPYPAEVGQLEPHLVVFRGNVYALSPYTVSAQTTKVRTSTSTVKSYTESEKPVSKNERKLKYGKYDLIDPFRVQPLVIHYETKATFKKVVSLVREIEVSHWGNIYVEETYEIKNGGAKHTGPFSRLKYSHLPNGQGTSFRDLKARLPASAHSLYYVDVIGNISTSNTRRTISETVLDFETRFPLFGGWKTDFKIGYSVPLEGFLFKKKSDGKHRLTLGIGSSLEGVYVESLEVRVVLPEGSTAITASLPWPVDSQAFDVKYTYLDTSGRPVLVLRKARVVPDHAGEFSVDYAFAQSSMLREPLLLIAAFATLFVVAIAYNRLEWTITKDERWQEEQKAGLLSAVLQQISAVVEEQEEAVAVVGRLTQTMRTLDDAEHAVKERNVLEHNLNALDTKARALAQQAEPLAPQAIRERLRDGLDRLKASESKLLRVLSDKADAIKKGKPPAEASKAVAPSAQQALDARREALEALEILFD